MWCRSGGVLIGIFAHAPQGSARIEIVRPRNDGVVHRDRRARFRRVVSHPVYWSRSIALRLRLSVAAAAFRLSGLARCSYALPAPKRSMPIWATSVPGRSLHLVCLVLPMLLPQLAGQRPRWSKAGLRPEPIHSSCCSGAAPGAAGDTRHLRHDHCQPGDSAAPFMRAGDPARPMFRLHITRPRPTVTGQIYVGSVNWVLMT